jgi:16S rRNA (uracil1498-N3)-methyltransferase
MKSVLVSALLQSQQTWLPVLQEPVAFDTVVRQLQQDQKFIAHCVETDRKSLAELAGKGAGSQVVLIGPEGDFTPAEISTALEQGFVPVTLGETRLRTETAGVVAAALMMIR